MVVKLLVPIVTKPAGGSVARIVIANCDITAIVVVIEGVVESAVESYPSTTLIDLSWGGLAKTISPPAVYLTFGLDGACNALVVGAFIMAAQ